VGNLARRSRTRFHQSALRARPSTRRRPASAPRQESRATTRRGARASVWAIPTTRRSCRSNGTASRGRSAPPRDLDLAPRAAANWGARTRTACTQRFVEVGSGCSSRIAAIEAGLDERLLLLAHRVASRARGLSESDGVHLALDRARGLLGRREPEVDRLLASFPEFVHHPRLDGPVGASARLRRGFHERLLGDGRLRRQRDERAPGWWSPGPLRTAP
jgi:hypothetical protein